MKTLQFGGGRWDGLEIQFPDDHVVPCEITLTIFGNTTGKTDDGKIVLSTKKKTFSYVTNPLDCQSRQCVIYDLMPDREANEFDV